ncbi:MAG: hypothetical protein LBG13_01355, partial [Holosporales bacterium]|nr:hypothetical protein [Holosporales bacterium]
MVISACGTSPENSFQGAGFEKSLSRHIKETNKFKNNIQSSHDKIKNNSFVRSLDSNHVLKSFRDNSADRSAEDSYEDSVISGDNTEARERKEQRDSAGYHIDSNSNIEVVSEGNENLNVQAIPESGDEAHKASRFVDAHESLSSNKGKSDIHNSDLVDSNQSSSKHSGGHRANGPDEPDEPDELDRAASPTHQNNSQDIAASLNHKDSSRHRTDGSLRDGGKQKALMGKSPKGKDPKNAITYNNRKRIETNMSNYYTHLLNSLDSPTNTSHNTHEEAFVNPQDRGGISQKDDGPQNDDCQQNGGNSRSGDDCFRNGNCPRSSDDPRDGGGLPKGSSSR